MAEAPRIAIDLGTAYARVGVFQNGKVNVIANDLGQIKTPCYVAFTDTECLVGDAAKSQASKNLMNTIFDVKRLIGMPFDDEVLQSNLVYWPFEVINVNGRPKFKVQCRGESKNFSPEEITSMILRKMKETAEAYLGTTVTNAVVTVPSYFNNSQRVATINAASIAGLRVCLINDTSAAALAYSFNHEDRNTHVSTGRNVLIFDLGSGTFDVSILTIENGTLEVKSTLGDTHLGGEDFFKRMVNAFIQRFNTRYGTDFFQNKSALRGFWSCCEELQRSLSFNSQASGQISLIYEGTKEIRNLSVGRDLFEELNADLLRSIIKLVRECLLDAGMGPENIQDIVLAGGPTSIPMVSNWLRNFFSRRRLNSCKDVLPDFVVIHGAALQAALLNDEIQDMLLLDVTPHSLVFETSGDVKTAIERNNIIPRKYTHMIYKNMDSQTSEKISVYEGYRDKGIKLLDNFEISKLTLDIRGRPLIEVTFDIDVNCILKVTAFEKRRSVPIAVSNYRGHQYQQEMDRIEHRAVYDRQRAASQAWFYCFNVKSAVQDKSLQGILSKAYKNKILKKCYEVHLWLNANKLAKKEQFEQKQKELEHLCNPFITKLYLKKGMLRRMPDNMPIAMGGLPGGAPPAEGSADPTCMEVIEIS